MIETVQTIRELLTLNVKIIVTTQGPTFDQSPYSTFLIQLFACLAELESSHASERIRAGLKVAKAKGKELGRPIDVKKRAKLARWDKARIPVKEQAKRLGVALSRSMLCAKGCCNSFVAEACDRRLLEHNVIISRLDSSLGMTRE